jgi:hypothetical protein
MPPVTAAPAGAGTARQMQRRLAGVILFCFFLGRCQAARRLSRPGTEALACVGRPPSAWASDRVRFLVSDKASCASLANLRTGRCANVFMRLPLNNGPRGRPWTHYFEFPASFGVLPAGVVGCEPSGQIDLHGCLEQRPRPLNPLVRVGNRDGQVFGDPCGGVLLEKVEFSGGAQAGLQLVDRAAQEVLQFAKQQGFCRVTVGRGAGFVGFGSSIGQVCGLPGATAIFATDIVANIGGYANQPALEIRHLESDAREPAESPLARTRQCVLRVRLTRVQFLEAQTLQIITVPQPQSPESAGITRSQAAQQWHLRVILGRALAPGACRRDSGCSNLGAGRGHPRLKFCVTSAGGARTRPQFVFGTARQSRDSSTGLYALGRPAGLMAKDKGQRMEEVWCSLDHCYGGVSRLGSGNNKGPWKKAKPQTDWQSADCREEVR